MACKRSQNPPKDGIHFVNARPTSESERINTQRIVRAHVGRWISDQTRDRAESSNPSRAIPHPITYPVHNPSLTLIPALPVARPIDPTGAFERSSFPLASRPSCSPYRGNRPPSPRHDLLYSIPDDSKWRRSPFPPSHNSDSSESSVESSPPPDAWPSTATFTSVEQQISPFLDPFYTYPSGDLNISPAMVDARQHYCSFYLSLCNSVNVQDACLNVLWPGLVPRSSSKSVSSTRLPKPPELWYSLSRSDPALHMAFMYGSLCHQRVLYLNQWGPSVEFGPREDALLQVCEMESIKHINAAVRDPSRMVSDAVLLSVICMAHHQAPDKTHAQSQSIPFNPPFQWLQWLNVYGCLKPNEIHIHGLVALIKIRGGLRNIKYPGLATTLSFSEIFAAACWCIQPIFEFWPLDESRLGISVQDLLGFGPSDVQRGFGQFQVIGFTPQMAAAFQAARAYINILECIGSDDPSRNGVNHVLLTDQRNLTEYTLLAVLPAPQVLNHFAHSTQSATYEACRLASLIFGVGVIFPIPAQNSPLTRLAQEIHAILLQPSSSVLWSSSSTRVPLVWILTLAGIAASETSYRSFFVSALAGTARRSGLSSWLELRDMLTEMIWHNTAGETAGKVLWAEVEASWQRTKPRA
ncbi:Protein of unknown function DUF3468 [Penicillium angulare]|uniref:Protein of unknown function DUF3468 n=1 Tax=Penicillium angulare TaxID=116970 RepID=UPI0025418995|nr:Protein of unknown function DUF3468 [Penicillium angulare]KAJ5273803.1 Protein of unknown function DUF3468 [Penicillium angulare]